MSLPTEAITTRTPETHAYHIPHVGITNTQIHKSVVSTDNTSARNNILIVAEKGSTFTINTKQFDSTNFGSLCDSSRIDDSKEIPSDARDEIHPDNQREAKNYNKQTTIANNEDIVRALSNVGHIYEEVRAIKEPRGSSYEYDIRDYYEKYSPATAKTLIDTLFLPRYTICRECASTKNSPVYTDRLIYTKESLLAVEVILYHRDDVSCFKYPREATKGIFCSQYDQSQDCMLVYNYTKTNAAGIFYSHCWPRDVFDLQSLLMPSIHVINRACSNLVVNTQLYHRCINSYHVRTSKTGCASMTFYRDCGTLISCTSTCISHNDSQNPLIYQVHQLKDDDTGEHRRNRSSLLLLEPLLLMPESMDSRYREDAKNRSERMKIVRIIMVYALSFLFLANITFYIVYFT